MKHFINLKDIPAKDLRKILIDAKRRKKARKKLNNLERIVKTKIRPFIVDKRLSMKRKLQVLEVHFA